MSAQAKQLRNQVASTNNYWDKPGLALSMLAELLAEFGIAFHGSISINDAVDGRTSLTLVQEDTGEVIDDCSLIFSWYRMPSGRFEITCYLS